MADRVGIVFLHHKCNGLKHGFCCHIDPVVRVLTDHVQTGHCFGVIPRAVQKCLLFLVLLLLSNHAPECSVHLTEQQIGGFVATGPVMIKVLGIANLEDRVAKRLVGFHECVFEPSLSVFVLAECFLETLLVVKNCGEVFQITSHLLITDV